MKPMSTEAWPDAVQNSTAQTGGRVIVIDLTSFFKGAPDYSRQDIVRQLEGYVQAGDKVLFSMRDYEAVQEIMMRGLIGGSSSLGHEHRFVFSREEIVEKFPAFDIYMDDRNNRWGAPCAQYVSSGVADPWTALDLALKGLKDAKAAPAPGMAPAI